MSKELNDRLTRIKKNIVKKEIPGPNLYIVPKVELVNKFLNSESENQVIDNFLYDSKERYTFELNPIVNDKEIKELLNILNGKYDYERLNLLVNDCKKSVMDSIIRPFGLAGIIFADKVGGNVDTIHNVREGVYATDENKKRYEDRGEYKCRDYHDGNENYRNHRKNIQNLINTNQTIIDEYTRLEIESDDIVSIEHIISASDISKDPAVSLSRADGSQIANDDSNLCYINGQLNCSINADSPSKYLDRMKSLKNPEARQNMLNYLNNKTEPLSPRNQKDKKLLEQKNAIVENEENVRKLEENARKAIEKKVNTEYYSSKEFVSNVGKTSAKEGLKMAFKQSIGIMLREFSLAVFAEIEDIFSKRKDIKINNEFIQDLKQRLERIANRVMLKWKDVVAGFGSGAISGLFSNLITVIVNVFFTTSKRVVRMIREGFYSLLKALKMLFIHPENMSIEEVAHEVSKLIASGLIITGGIAIEEVLQKSLMSIPIIGMFSDIIATVVLGIVTGLSMALVVYLIDKIDLFKVNANKRQEYISNELDVLIEKDLNDIEDAYKYIASTLGI
ncbi:hypothetical protein G9F72_019390 [Clostridium estertheticum]|uniref:hypothetical protein n=1 Tax=Clostridium estertheticum TaxID=238834 RepID=UPI0013E943C2|nr:hypothetical protein [Clostridium estertheticum]MBZ9688497.1 hypothetical protein [Clostridium estertheticum]